MAKSLVRGPVTMASVTLVLAAFAGCKAKPAPPQPAVEAASAVPSSVFAASSTAVDASIAVVDPAENKPFDAGSPTPTWRGNERVVSRDGAVALDYPSNVFKTTSTKNGSVTLTSTVSEPSLSGKPGDEIVYTLTLTKLGVSPQDAVKKHLPPGFADRLPTTDGTVDAYAGANGAKGYTLTQSVEGLGATYVIATTHDGQSWEMTCDFCCGMVVHAKMTAEDQIALCEDVLHVFEAQH